MATRSYYVFDLRQRVISTRGDVVPAPYVVARAGSAAGLAAVLGVPQSIGMGYMYGQSFGVAAVSGRSQFLVSGQARAVGSAAGAATLQAYAVGGTFATAVGASAGVASIFGAGSRNAVSTAAGSASGASTVSGAPINPDPYFGYVSLLVPADGTDGATTAPDRSIYLRTLTGVGTAALSTARKKNGSASLAFGDTIGSGGRFSVLSNSTMPSAFDLALNDFTLELSYYMAVSGEPAAATIPLFTLGKHWTDTTTSANGVHGFVLEWETGGALRGKFTNGQAAGTVTAVETTTTAPYNRFCDIAVTKSAGYIYLHVDGALMAQRTLAGGNLSFPALLDCNVGGSQSFSTATGALVSTLAGVGNIDNLRLTVGFARYGAANYTPSPEPFPTY